MTSSLVGSEMCIRDRPLIMYGYAPHKTTPMPEIENPSKHWMLPSMWRRAVSYTHLTLPTICSV
eukprot:11451240-Prorocentrum_lima.AAC.1